MRLLRCQEDGKFELTHFGEKTEIPNYAILSHTWLSDTTEITYNDLVAGHLEDKRASYNKLRFCAEQTVADGLQYFWVDTCCINQADSSELQEAIMSMFRWYRAASKCYVYLSDVSAADEPPSTPDSEHDNQPWWEPAFRNSRWFTRGWTLQELLAPHAVDFFSREGSRLGDKTSLDRTLHEITGIPLHILRGEELPFVDKSLVSAAGRRKKDCEDTAYCVHGVYDVDMTRMYGKGENTPVKLRELEDKTTWAHTAAETDRSFETRNRIQKSSRWLAVDAMLGLSQVFVAIPIVMYFPLRDVSSLEAPTVNFVRSHIRGLTNIVQHSLPPIVSKGITDPSPTTFLVACVVLGTVSIVQYHRNESNRFQQPLLEAGLALSLLSGLGSESTAAWIANAVALLPLVALACPLLSQAAEVARHCLSVKKGLMQHEILAWTQGRDTDHGYLERV